MARPDGLSDGGAAVAGAEIPGDAAAELVEIVGALRRADAADGHEGERARVLAGLLEHPRIEVELQTVVRGRPNAIARVRGSGDGPGLLLDGHFNAGYHPGPWSGDPCDPWVRDGRLFGGAVTDMLGGLAAMVLALRALADCDPAPPGDVVLLAGMHEDTIGLGTKAALASRDGWPAYGICGDPTNLGILTAHGGAVKFAVELTGKAAHITRAEEGADALSAAAALAQALPRHAFRHVPDPALPDLPRTVVGRLDAGFAAGVVAPSAILQGDVRTVPGMTPASVLADVERCAAETVAPEVGVAVRALFDQRPLPGPAPDPLVAAISAAHRAVRGSDPEVGSALPGQAYCTEAADMAAFGIGSVVYGPSDWRYVPDESVAVADLLDAARVYAATALLLDGDRPQKPSR
jgi:acetylornithine deacetylase/succinyl-diaminopimelate desuccinylase-like protein